VLTRHGSREGVSFFSADFPTDKQDRHNYTQYYDIALQPYFNLRAINLLGENCLLSNRCYFSDVTVNPPAEIGVKKGGSLKMWRELFSRKSHIVGVDIDAGAPTFPRDPNIKVIISDSRVGALTNQSYFNEMFVRSGIKFDIIVDDGDHSAAAQVTVTRCSMIFVIGVDSFMLAACVCAKVETFMNLRQLLKPTGVYIIEDVNNVQPGDYTVFAPGWQLDIHRDKVRARCLCNRWHLTQPLQCITEMLMYVFPPHSLARRTTLGRIDY
jgi:hypothetical protein